MRVIAIHQDSRIHRDALCINYLLELKWTQTQNTGYHLDVHHFLWKLDMQTIPIYHKQKQQFRVIIYLGKSLQHSHNVTLVLNPMTELFSPKFHVNYYPSLRTVPEIPTEYQWHIKAGLVSKKLTKQIRNRNIKWQRGHNQIWNQHQFQISNKHLNVRYIGSQK